MTSYHIDTSVFPKEALARIDALTSDQLDAWKAERLAAHIDPEFRARLSPDKIRELFPEGMPNAN